MSKINPVNSGNVRIPPCLIVLIKHVIDKNWDGRHLSFAKEYHITDSWMSDLYNGKKATANVNSLNELTKALREDAEKLPDTEISQCLSNLNDFTGLFETAKKFFPSEEHSNSIHISFNVSKKSLYWLSPLIVFAALFAIFQSKSSSPGGFDSEYPTQDSQGLYTGQSTYFESELGESTSPSKEIVRRYFREAQNLYKQGVFAEASKKYRKSIALHPTVCAYLNWGASLFNSSDFDSATIIWQSGLNQIQNNDLSGRIFQSAFHLNLALGFQTLGKNYEATMHYRQGLLDIQEIARDSSANDLNRRNASKRYLSNRLSVAQRITDIVVGKFLSMPLEDPTQKFDDAVKEDGIKAKPFDNGGGLEPHLWGPIWVQDLRNERDNLWYVAVYNGYTGQVAFLEGALRLYWLSKDGNKLGAPINDRLSLTGPYIYGALTEIDESYPNYITVTVWIFGNPNDAKRTIVRNDKTGEFSVTPVGSVILKGAKGSAWYIRTDQQNGVDYLDEHIFTLDSDGAVQTWLEPGDYRFVCKKLDGSFEPIISRRVKEGDYEPISKSPNLTAKRQ